MNFALVILNQNIERMQDYVTRIQIVLSSILKLKMYINILLMMLKKDLIHQIMKLIDHVLQEKTKSYWINER